MRRVVIVIDPGHGGKDPGAIGTQGTKEADVNLAVAKLVASSLITRGLYGILTRPDDTFVLLQDRARQANSLKATLFLSIHCNAAINSNAGGTETFFCTGSKSGEEAANIIHSELVKATGLADRRIKNASFYVLRHTSMPAILTELGFISNPEEEKLLIDPEFQDRVAQALVFGITTYLKQ